MIDIENLTKVYGRHRAVDRVSFVCRPGRVTGFLGPNGAGKSTTLRILTGLARPDSGRATIDGRRYAEIPDPGRRIGVLLDASAQHPGRTGAEVLRLGVLTMGLPATRVAAVLDDVGLSVRESRKRVREYSLGMRQRLGLAHALLGDPAVLLLDEPANGLDPAGIHWMRTLLRHHADRGGTVLLSSHLLREVEAVADDLVVIGGGRIVAAGPKEDLVRGTGTQVRAVAEQTGKLTAALTRAGIAHAPAEDGLRAEATTEEVGRLVLRHGIVLTELRPAAGAGLEETFLRLTSHAQRDIAPEVTR